MQRKPLYLALAGAAALAALVLTAVLALGNDDGPAGDSSGRLPAPSATPGRPVIDPGIGNGRPPASTANPDRPVSNRDTPSPAAPTRTPAPSGGSTAPGLMRVLAPIEAASVAILESVPPQYRLQVKAGLPSGCAKADGHEVTRSGNDVRVAVYNTLPSGNVICTQIYGIYDLSIDLGTGFVAGQEYRVNVNGTMLTFRAR